MLELLCAIPENVGWALVGSSATVLAIMLFKLGKIFFEMYREWREYLREEKEDREKLGLD